MSPGDLGPAKGLLLALAGTHDPGGTGPGGHGAGGGAYRRSTGRGCVLLLARGSDLPALHVPTCKQAGACLLSPLLVNHGTSSKLRVYRCSCDRSRV